MIVALRARPEQSVADLDALELERAHGLVVIDVAERWMRNDTLRVERLALLAFALLLDETHVLALGRLVVVVVARRPPLVLGVLEIAAARGQVDAELVRLDLDEARVYHHVVEDALGRIGHRLVRQVAQADETLQFVIELDANANRRARTFVVVEM